MKKNKKVFPAIRIILSLIALILMSGVGVMAVTTKVRTIDIKLSNGYTMTVLTNKAKVADILKENNVLLQEDEKVKPAESENLTDEKEIVISNKSKQEVQVAKVSESGVESNLVSLLKAYDSITEKIEKRKEEIPFKTIKKDISDGAKSVKNKVIRKGENGIKEITYKVKYQNSTEIERKKISEKVIKKPVDKIVQVKSKALEVTSRASDTSRTSSSSSSSAKSDEKVKMYKVTAYCSCPKCCGKWANGITAMGTTAKVGRTVAAPRNFKFGTKLLIGGKKYVVEDRGGAIKGNRIDMYVSSHAAALRWGVKYLPVKVID